MPYTISLSFASTVCSFSCGFCRFIVCVFLLYFSLVWAWKFAFIRNRKIFFAGTSRWPLDNNIAWFNVSSCCMTRLMRTFFSFCCTLANIFVSYYGEKWSNSTTLTVNAKRNWRMKSKYIKSTSIWRKKEEKKNQTSYRKRINADKVGALSAITFTLQDYVEMKHGASVCCGSNFSLWLLLVQAKPFSFCYWHQLCEKRENEWVWKWVKTYKRISQFKYV